MCQEQAEGMAEHRQRWEKGCRMDIAEIVGRYRVGEGEAFRLADYDPSDTGARSW